MVTSKKVTICADDYGLYDGSTQAILQLVADQRLTAVSCVVNVQELSSCAQSLLSLKADIDIGLHLNLTEGYYLSQAHQALPSLKILLLKSQFRSLSVNKLKCEIEAQLVRFIQAYGRKPDFIDGHQHVHHLPLVRHALLEVYQQQKLQAYIRSVVPGFSKYRFKSAILSLTGGTAMQKLLTKQRLPHNSGFAGVYDFSAHVSYRKLMQDWLAQIPTGGLIMCHPGISCQTTHDAIANARVQEFAYLASKDFLDDCHAFNVELARFKI